MAFLVNVPITEEMKKITEVKLGPAKNKKAYKWGPGDRGNGNSEKDLIKKSLVPEYSCITSHAAYYVLLWNILAICLENEHFPHL